MLSRSLSALEDPTSQHVMPTATVRDGGDPAPELLMLPPTGLPNKRKRTKRVLEEEEYVDALSHIIERDYFPQLAASRGSVDGRDDYNGLSVDTFFQQYTSYDNDSFEDLQQKSVEEHQRRYHWLYELPDDGSGVHRRSGMLMLYYLGDKILTAEQRQKMDTIMNGEEHVGDNRPNGSQPWRFRVRNQFMFPPELAVSEDVCRMRDSEAPDLNDKNNKQEWKTILPVGQTSSLLLKNGEADTNGAALNTGPNNMAALQQALTRYNRRFSGVQVRGEKTIQRNNTNLPPPSSQTPTSTLTSEQLLSWDRSYRSKQQQQQQQAGALTAFNRGQYALEAPHTPSLRSSGGGSSTAGDSASE